MSEVQSLSNAQHSNSQTSSRSESSSSLPILEWLAAWLRSGSLERSMIVVSVQTTKFVISMVDNTRKPATAESVVAVGVKVGSLGSWVNEQPCGVLRPEPT